MNQYIDQMILSASPIEIICLLYKRAIRGVRDAREHLKAGQIAERTRAINHTWIVLLELINSLDRDATPDMAGQLDRLYGYMQSRLVEANLNQVEEPLSEVLMLLTTLAEGWDGLTAADRRRQEQPAWADVPLAEGECSRFAVSA